MSRYALPLSIAFLALGSGVYAQGTTDTAFVPLASKRIPYDQIPYKVDPTNGVRGTQFGYNVCNSTTENQQSLCQTSFLNSVDDFCLWGPPEPSSTIGDTEGEAVAWCTKPGRGTRLIPAGALHGVQFMKTPDYVQVVGFIDQTKINIADGDYGGEMDPHGADLRGNPLGGLVYSNAWGGGSGGFQQVIEWHNFMGSNIFCLKTCDPAGPNAARFCEHVYDRIGCAYNAPNAAANGTFSSCEGDNQDYPGVYTDAAGAVQTYRQPPESLGPISTIPYDPKIPASSNCQTYTSSVLYSALGAVPSGTVPSTTGANPSSTPAGSPGSSSSRTSSSGSPGATGGATGDNNGAQRTVVGLSSLVGIALAAMLFA